MPYGVSAFNLEDLNGMEGLKKLEEIDLRNVPIKKLKDMPKSVKTLRIGQ